MTNLEMTKLAAEAMELRLMLSEVGEVCTYGGVPLYWRDDGADSALGAWRAYDPLHDDAQAMALDTIILREHCGMAWTNERLSVTRGLAYIYESYHNMLDPANRRRAIVECVAKLQLASAEKKAPAN